MLYTHLQILLERDQPDSAPGSLYITSANPWHNDDVLSWMPCNVDVDDDDDSLTIYDTIELGYDDSHIAARCAAAVLPD